MTLLPDVRIDCQATIRQLVSSNRHTDMKRRLISDEVVPKRFLIF